MLWMPQSHAASSLGPHWPAALRQVPGGDAEPSGTQVQLALDLSTGSVLGPSVYQFLKSQVPESDFALASACRGFLGRWASWAFQMPGSAAWTKPVVLKTGAVRDTEDDQRRARGPGCRLLGLSHPRVTWHPLSGTVQSMLRGEVSH